MLLRLAAFATAVMSFALLPSAIWAEPGLKALIVDGQNNHGNWQMTTRMMKRYLEDTKLFTVEVATTAKQGTDESFKPEFAKYDVVVNS